MVFLSPLPDIVLRPLVDMALREDLGRAGDITTNAVIPSDAQWSAGLYARKPGVLAGIDLARLAFQLIDPDLQFLPEKRDGEKIEGGDCVAKVSGAARSILSAERVALNFICHMSGIATQTRRFVDAVSPYKTRICCTRKTTPGLRIIEKYAVRAGGGSNHRFGLDDAVMIKDNHIAVAGGIKQAILCVSKQIGHLVKVEVEVDGLSQLEEVLSLLREFPVDVVLLDNMPPAILKQAVQLVAGRLITEASGGVSLENVAKTAATGVDIISIGGLTHSAAILDIGLDPV